MKTINLIIISIFFTFISNTIFAQHELFISNNIKNAYEKGTRSYNGMPGENYWQNGTYYKIKANINPENRILTGNEEITYFNNSPDTLKKVVLKLYQNFYKEGAVRNVNITPETITDGIILKKILMNDNEFDLNDNKKIIIEGTNLTLKLDELIIPKSTAKFFIDWQFKIPSGTNIRMGTYDSTTFFIGYWYPKIAVYDDIDGWDMHQYDGEHEFYNEYGDYEVEITVPDGSGIWATGLLQNADDILNDKFFDRYEEALSSDSVVNIITKDDLSNKNIYNDDNGYVTWKYSADYVPDFAFGLSDHYLWDACSAEIDNGKEVLVISAYNPEAEFFKDVTKVSRETVLLYSTISPKYPYPYPAITVFNGDGGMEFPMIVNDGAFANKVNDIYVTTHEITHMYFPFYVGVNETKYMWMEEGMAYMLPYDIQLNFVDYDHRIRAARGLANFEGNEYDYPLMIPSTASTGIPLTLLSYYKAGVAYDMLKNALGEDLFYKALNEYINRWDGMHPTPYDFFYTFNDVIGKNLNWFWKPWFFEKTTYDLALENVEITNNKIKFVVNKLGNAPLPVFVNIELMDGDIIEVKENASIWSDGKKEITIEKEVNGIVKSIRLGNGKIPDSNPENNLYNVSE